MKNAITYGLIYGVITALFSMLQLHGSIGMLVSFLISIAVMIFLMVIAGRKYRDENNGFASFGSMYKFFVVFLLVSSLLSLALNYVYTNHILSQDSKEQIMDNMVEKQLAMMGKLLPDDQLETMEDQIALQAENMFSPQTQALGLLGALVGALLIALIPAAIMKKDKRVTNTLDGHL